MKRATIAEARARLDELVEAALQGEEVLLTGPGERVLKLVPLPAVEGTREETEGSEPALRRLGQWKGRVWIAPDFDETPEDVIESFYSGDP